MCFNSLSRPTRSGRGFTLIELSIVLVIIGLLIGGILVAKSMISTAKLQGVVRQLSQLDIAVTNFRSKYNQIPGDTNLFPNPGDNDGQVRNDGSLNESANVWYHLSLGVGLKNSKNADYAPFVWGTDAFSESNSPKFSIDQKNTCPAGLQILAANSQNSTGVKNYFNYFCSPTTDDPLYVYDVKILDIKIDDGNPVDGKLQSINYAGVSPPCASGNHYNTQIDGVTCIIFLELGAISIRE